MERAVTFDFLRASKRQKVTDAPPDTRGFQQVLWFGGCRV
jgi:hypothetical protein